MLCSSSITSIRTPVSAHRPHRHVLQSDQARSVAAIRHRQAASSTAAKKRLSSGAGGHLHRQHRHPRHRAFAEIGLVDRRIVLAPELLDDHRLAVVGRPDQQEIRHARALRERRAAPPALDGGVRPCVADPPIHADMPDTDLGRAHRPTARTCGIEMRDRTNPLKSIPRTFLIHAVEVEGPWPRSDRAALAGSAGRASDATRLPRHQRPSACAPAGAALSCSPARHRSAMPPHRRDRRKIAVLVDSARGLPRAAASAPGDAPTG